jgi:hypothetical protein
MDKLAYPHFTTKHIRHHTTQKDSRNKCMQSSPASELVELHTKSDWIAQTRKCFDLTAKFNSFKTFLSSSTPYSQKKGHNPIFC